MRTLICVNLLIALALLSGCGQPGAPRPPSLQLPLPVSDLKAVRKGDAVTLTWTVPTRTTDDDKLRSLGATRICRTVTTVTEAMKPAAPGGQACSKPLVEIPVGGSNTTTVDVKGVPQQQATMRDVLPQDLIQSDPARIAQYSVEVVNDRGRSAGASNASMVSLARQEQPTDMTVRVTAKGPYLTWFIPAGAADRFVIKRRESAMHGLDSPSAQQREISIVADHLCIDYASGTSSCSWSDTAFEWEANYEYRVAEMIQPRADAKNLDRLAFEGDDSKATVVFVHDTFPPAIPTGLQAVYSEVNGERGIDLTWNANADSDLAGYNVYRRPAGGEAWSKANAELVKTPTYRDAGALQSNSSYEFAVSALDVRANESAKSSLATERVP